MALVDRAKIYWMQGERGQAIDKLKLAIDAIEAQRSSIQTEAFKIGFVGDKQKAYGQIVDYLVAEHRNAEAFQYAERAKARALVDMLASKSSFANASSASGHSVAELDELELTLAANDARLDAGSAKRTRGLMMSAKQDVVQSDPALASLVTVDTPQPAELQTRLAPGEVILEYYGAGEHLFAFVVSSRQISVVPIDATGLDAAVSHFRRAILDVNSEAYLADAQSLYRRLVTPVGRQIEGHKLVIVPQGALHYLPFAALHDGSEFFIDRFKYRVLPSASVIELLNTHPAANHSLSLLALGNPDLGDPRYALPGAEQEVENLGKLMPSARIVVHRNATETLLKQYGGLARYVHIASHGQFNPQHPLASRLLLAPDKDNDGNLTVAELYDLKLDADMVVLSACQTGLGDVESGDDVIGLTRGFLYAGASNIIASLWVVDDKATSLLMTDLYKQLDTTDKETALRDAQLDVKANYNSHPFYWAAFQLTGKG